ncbi:MAG: hypothetical protein H6739_29465 [Alphaproteobacteria bacterium]|nr:hypothetical protein [Alphaproteobacteria bacterium]
MSRLQELAIVGSPLDGIRVGDDSLNPELFPHSPEGPRQKPRLPVGRNIIEKDEPAQLDTLMRSQAGQRGDDPLVAGHREHGNPNQAITDSIETDGEPSCGKALAVVVLFYEGTSQGLGDDLDPVPAWVDGFPNRPIAGSSSSPSLASHRQGYRWENPGPSSGRLSSLSRSSCDLEPFDHLGQFFITDEGWGGFFNFDLMEGKPQLGKFLDSFGNKCVVHGATPGVARYC